MIKPIQAILYILRNNVINDDKTVPVIKRNYPLDKTPCINIDDSASIITVDKRIYNKKNENNEPKQYYRVRRKTILNIHVWVDSEQQRENICNQITNLFTQAYLDNYQFCINYNKKTQECEKLETTCPTINQSKHLYKSTKYKCPQPTTYGYENIFTHYDLIKQKWDLQTPYSNDNTNTKPPTLHSIFRLNAEYYDYTEIGGITIKDIKYHGKEKN